MEASRLLRMVIHGRLNSLGSLTSKVPKIMAPYTHSGIEAIIQGTLEVQEGTFSKLL